MKNINKNNLKKILYKMLLIRETDLQISKRYSENEMRCPTYSS
jgi:TPP-dependent pyruvate/acetoin dehydrogenase alpha subunit